MSGGGPQMRAGGLRGTVALVGFIALIVIAAMFGGCGIIGSPVESSGSGDDVSESPSPSTGPSVAPPPASARPPQPLPRGTATPTLPLPRLDKVPQNDAGEVSSSALTMMYTYDTTTDTTTHDAVLRAEPWMTAEYAAEQRDHVSVAAPGAQWATWRDHQAYTMVTLRPGTEVTPSDTATAAYRQWLVTYTPVGRDGWRGEPIMEVAYVALERATASDPWRVGQLRVSSS